MYCTYSLNTLYTSDYVTNILHILLWVFINYEHSYSSLEREREREREREGGEREGNTDYSRIIYFGLYFEG